MRRVPAALPFVTVGQRWPAGRALGPRVRTVSSVLLLVTLGIVGIIVFSPGTPAPRGQSVLRLWAGIWRLGGVPPTFLTFETIEAGANVLMFLPLGVLFAAAVRPRSRYLGLPVAAGVAVFVETVQLFLPERVSSVSDVVANTVGALLGVLLLVRLTERLPHP
jgi:VanZ family protein